MKKNITLTFPKNAPFIIRYLEADWRDVNSLKDALDFYHKWHNRLLISTNEVAKQTIKSIIYPLYSKLTNISYESNINIS